jgi:hypothetical protein
LRFVVQSYGKLGEFEKTRKKKNRRRLEPAARVDLMKQNV